jgi:hypothetical protein
MISSHSLGGERMTTWKTKEEDGGNPNWWEESWERKVRDVMTFTVAGLIPSQLLPAHHQRPKSLDGVGE